MVVKIYKSAGSRMAQRAAGQRVFAGKAYPSHDKPWPASNGFPSLPGTPAAVDKLMPVGTRLAAGR